MPLVSLKILLLIPIAATIVAFFRNLIGFETYGVFLPALIAVSGLHAKQGNPEEGLRLIAEAEAFVESSGFNAIKPLILSSRAFVLIESEQYEDALAVMESYMALNPHSVSGHNRLGKILYETGDYKEAKKSYSNALQFSPAGPTGLLGMRRASPLSKTLP